MHKDDELPMEIATMLDTLSIEIVGKSYIKNTGLVTSLRVTLGIKGNAKVIKALKDTGWREVSRRKSIPPYNVRCEYAGYSFNVTLELDMRGR